MGDLGPDAVDYYWKEIYTVIEPIIQKVGSSTCYENSIMKQNSYPNMLLFKIISCILQIIDKYINKVELENFLTVLSSGNDIFQKSKKKSCFDLN